MLLFNFTWFSTFCGIFLPGLSEKSMFFITRSSLLQTSISSISLANIKQSSLFSRNEILTIAIKNSQKADIKIFCSSQVLLSFTQSWPDIFARIVGSSCATGSKHLRKCSFVHLVRSSICLKLQQQQVFIHTVSVIFLFRSYVTKLTEV